MATSPVSASPLVSVVIPCYNHGPFLAEAIDSVLQQTWSPIEIIVVDDGSSDNTRLVADQYPLVRYVYQTNQGLSAARNTGVHRSRGEFILFLDADDWLYADGIEYNLRQLQQHPEAVFVSGAHDKVDSNKNFLSEKMIPVVKGHYLRLLECNYIGMHATVLYRRSLFDNVSFDTSLRACEDYDLYLRIARHHPVLHHTHKIAAYRIHGSNMSSNVPLMLKTVFQVLSRQAEGPQTKLERESYDRGRQMWRDYYGREVYNRLRANWFVDKKAAEKEALTLLREYKYSLYIRYWTTKLLLPLKSS